MWSAAARGTSSEGERYASRTALVRSVSSVAWPGGQSNGPPPTISRSPSGYRSRIADHGENSTVAPSASPSMHAEQRTGSSVLSLAPHYRPSGLRFNSALPGRN